MFSRAKSHGRTETLITVRVRSGRSHRLTLGPGRAFDAMTARNSDHDASEAIRRRPWFRILLCGVLLVAGCSSGGSGAEDQAGSTTTGPKSNGAVARPTGPTRHLTAPFFGFNAASIVQTVNVDLLLDPKLQVQLTTFPTRLLRIPTGTAAQWIEWRTGRFVDRPGSPFAKIGPERRPVTMTDWATLVRTTGATPVWDLNVLTSTLDEQLAMLATAKRLGMPVRYIELGNEMWDPRSIYPQTYPSGTAYAEAMNTWIPALRRAYPDALISVSGADPTNPLFSKSLGDRYRSWNREVLSTIHDADAISIHPYWSLPDGAAPGSDSDATLEAGLDSWNALHDEALPPIPKGMAVWLTEWNQAAFGQSAGTQIWAQALSVVAVALAQLVDPRIEMSLVHDIVDGVRNPHDVGISVTFPAFTDGADGSRPMARTGLGVALPLLFGAVGPTATVRSVTVTNVPKVGAHPGVEAVVIGGPNPGAVFVNRTDRPIEVALTGALAGRWKATAVSADPDARPGWVATDHVRTMHAAVDRTVTLPASSVTRLRRH